MASFILSRIEKAADISLENGQLLYQKYFVVTDIYKSFKAEVDERLISDGYQDVLNY